MQQQFVQALPVAMIALGVLAERASLARSYPLIPFWWLKGLAFLLAAAMIAQMTGHGEALIPGIRLIDGSRLGLVGGVAAGIVLQSFAAYWLHRALHRFDVLFRCMHQMHHSVERVDSVAALYVHPFEFLVQGMLAAYMFRVVLGLPLFSTAVAVVVLFGINLFQHLNIRTPRWVGWFVQRPEAHNIHHQRGVHAFNYCDLPVWDMVFGTYKNPAEFAGESGFYPFASTRLGAMLIGRDVSNRPLN